MRLIFFLSFLTLTSLSCKYSSKPPVKKTFKAFDYTYSNPVKLIFYSIKFTNNDTLFVKQYLPSMLDSSYYAVLSRHDKANVDSFINTINLSMVDTSYEEGNLDGESYQFYIDKDTVKKSIYVHSDKIPKELNSFRVWLKEMKKNLNLIPIDTAIHFKSQKQFSLPKSFQPLQRFTIHNSSITVRLVVE